MNVDAAAATNSRTELLKENEQLRLRLEEAETALRVMGKRRMAADVVAAPSGEIDTLRQTEEELRAREAHLNEAQRLAQMGSWQRDYVKNTLTWSDGMYLISELTPEEFNDNFDNYLNIVHPDDRELLLRTAQEAHSAQLPYDLEYRLIMPDAGIKWVHSRATASYDENGIPLIMTGIHRDITDRKQAEAELSRTKGLRNLIIDAVPAYISYVDRECRYQLVNRRYEELTGLSVKNIRGRLVRDILGEIAWAEASPYVDRVLAGEEVTYETKFTGVDGKLRTLQVFHTPDRGPDGEVLGSVVLVHDITEKKKTEQTLQSYSRRLIDLEEEVRKNLAAELHDELGPELTALTFTLALINNDTTEPGGRLSLLMADATQLVDDMSGKVRNIIARLQPPVLSSYGVAAALRWYADQMKRRTGMNVTVAAERTFPRMPADQELAMFRIAKEALTNAAKYSGAKSVMVRLRSGERSIRLTVSDNGVGFAPSVPPRPGSGWGVSIMKMRAEMLGGSFRLRTAPGRGTVIHLTLPKEEIHAD